MARTGKERTSARSTIRLRSLPPEAAGLNPGIRETMPAISPEEEHPADRGHLPTLMIGHEPQGLEVASAEPTDGRERLGSRSEVQRFRVESGHRLFSNASLRPKRLSSSTSSRSARQLVEPTRTYTPPSGLSRVR
jgi:hypothetical protein